MIQKYQTKRLNFGYVEYEFHGRYMDSCRTSNYLSIESAVEKIYFHFEANIRNVFGIICDHFWYYLKYLADIAADIFINYYK